MMGRWILKGRNTLLAVALGIAVPTHAAPPTPPSAPASGVPGDIPRRVDDALRSVGIHGRLAYGNWWTEGNVVVVRLATIGDICVNDAPEESHLLWQVAKRQLGLRHARNSEEVLVSVVAGAFGRSPGEIRILVTPCWASEDTCWEDALGNAGNRRMGDCQAHRERVEVNDPECSTTSVSRFETLFVAQYYTWCKDVISSKDKEIKSCDIRESGTPNRHIFADFSAYDPEWWGDGSPIWVVGTVQVWIDWVQGACKPLVTVDLDIGTGRATSDSPPSGSYLSKLEREARDRPEAELTTRFGNRAICAMVPKAAGCP